MLSFLILSAIAAVSADSRAYDGACPDVTPVQNFNLTAYQGRWYGISNLPEPNQVNGACSQAEYTLEGDIVKLKNSHVINGVLAYIEGTARFADDANNSAKLVVTFTFGDLVRDAPLIVISTDYTNYAIAYNCKYDGQTNTHTYSGWVLSRTPQLGGELKTLVDDFFKTNIADLDLSEFEENDFSEEACKYEGTIEVTQPARQ